jgi:hypothetical protein
MTFSHRLCVFGLLLTVSCGSSSEEEPLLLQGGRLRVAACDYDVVTTTGMSAPVLGKNEVGSDPAAHRIHLGLAGDPATTMVVSWRTRDETTLASTVELTAVGGAPVEIQGVTYVYAAAIGGPPGGRVRVHEAHLCGLQPDTEYSYRVGGAGTFSAPATFRTAPLRTADEEVVIAVLGDTRSGYDVWAEALATLDEVGAPDLVLFTGDAVTLGELQTEWDEFFAVAEPLLKRVPMISAIGNHEVNSPTFLALTPNRSGGVFDYGPVHITVLDDNLSPETGAAPALQASLTAAAARPWKLVLHHKATYSAAANHGSDEALRALFGPIFDQHHVDLVVNGHDHNYERSHPMKNGAVAASAAEGTVYLVSGGAGAVLYDPGVGFWTAISEKRHHFVLLRVRPGRLELRAHDTTGAMFDELVITK